MRLRPATNGDSDAVIALIGGIYEEYGFRICLEDAEADLTDIEANFPDGAFMVLCDEDDHIRASVAVVRDSNRDDVAWMKRLYLDRTLQGSGAAGDLLRWALERAMALGCRRMELWSDTRFERAHGFYRKHGFEHDGTIRHMTDAYEPYDELFFSKLLAD